MTFKSTESELKEMLAYRRPAGCKTERRFINDFIRPLGVEQDRAGNLYKIVGDQPPEIMWSCHTDTVSRVGGMQQLTAKDGIIRVADKTSNCLGGDDTAGVWICKEMINAKVPGLYIFHRAEEIGGVGSTFITSKTPELVSGIKAAIAIDRKGTTDVITHQGGRTASDAFADSLARGLNVDGRLKMRSDDSGLFTDTANYVDLIGECTNLASGYEGAHSAAERQSVPFLCDLRDALCTLDVKQLVYSRKPRDVDHDYANSFAGRSYGSSWGSTTTVANDFEGSLWEKYKAQLREDEKDANPFLPITDSRVRFASRELIRVVEDYPQAAAQLLLDYGISEEEVLEKAYELGVN